MAFAIYSSVVHYRTWICQILAAADADNADDDTADAAKDSQCICAERTC